MSDHTRTPSADPVEFILACLPETWDVRIGSGWGLDLIAPDGTRAGEVRWNLAKPWNCTPYGANGRVLGPPVSPWEAASRVVALADGQEEA